MPVTLRTETPPKLLRVELSGKLTHDDYQQFVPAAEKLIEEQGKVRVLMVMRDFQGWEMGAMWDDLKFDLKHFGHIERLAMVGDKAWEKGMSVFCKPFTTAKIRYFDQSELNAAEEWVREGLEEGGSTGSGGCCCTKPNE